MSGFQLHRLGQIMEPRPGNSHEVEGVLNPAAARGRDGHLYLSLPEVGGTRQLFACRQLAAPRLPRVLAC
jgi:hypothetical protein